MKIRLLLGGLNKVKNKFDLTILFHYICSMKYEARIFSIKSYEDNDSYAKEKFKTFIKNKGHVILSDVEDYNHDIITEKDGKKYYFELEVKRNYPFTNKNDFKFNSVSFLGRKKRLHDIHQFEYIIICKETEYAVGCPSNIIFNNVFNEEINISSYERKGLDEFYRVPKDNCYFFNLNKNK